MSVLVFTVPMPPNLANRPMHHMVKHRVKVGYWALLDLMFGFGYDQKALVGLGKVEARTKMKDLKAQITHARDFAMRCIQESGAKRFAGRETAPLPARWPRASISSTMYLGAAMDDGNAMNRHKWVEDWLVTRGYVEDDKRSCLTWDGLPAQVVKRDGNYKIVLTLTEMSGGSR